MAATNLRYALIAALVAVAIIVGGNLVGPNVSKVLSTGGQYYPAAT